MRSFTRLTLRAGGDGPAPRSLSPPDLLAADLVHRPLRVGDDEQRAVRALPQVRRDAEVLAEEQRLALGELVLGEVVGDLVAQAPVVDVDLLAVVRDLHAEDVAVAQGAAGRADEQVALVVLAEL